MPAEEYIKTEAVSTPAVARMGNASPADAGREKDAHSQPRISMRKGTFDWKRMRQKFMDEYYPLFRFFGYVAAALFTPGAKRIGDYLKAKENLAEEHKWQANQTVAPVQALAMEMNEIENKIASAPDITAPPGTVAYKDYLKSEWRNLETKRDLAVQTEVISDLNRDEDYLKRGKEAASRLETPFFLALTIWDFFREKKSFKTNLTSAVAAELGIKKEQVGLTHIMKSENPLVASVMNRFKIQNVTRVLSDLAFLIGVKTGIISKAVSITLERSTFLEKMAYDKLRLMVEEVQSDNFALRAKERLVDGFVNAMQRSRRDFQQPVLTRGDLDGISSLLDDMAQAVLDHKIGINEVVYMLGVGINERTPKLSREMFDKVMSIGLEGIAEQKLTQRYLQRQQEAMNRTEMQETALTQGKNSHAAPTVSAQQAILARGTRDPLAHATTLSPALAPGR